MAPRSGCARPRADPEFIFPFLLVFSNWRLQPKVKEMPAIHQNDMPLQFHSVTPAEQEPPFLGWDNPANLRCLRVVLDEALCLPFHAEIDLAVSQNLLDTEGDRYLSGALWQLFDLKLDTRGETATSESRTLRGLVTAFTDLGTINLPFPGRHVRVIFEPEVVRLRQHLRSRVHSGTLVEILETILGTMPRRCTIRQEINKYFVHQKTQFEESDLHFFMRLAEEYGLTWFLDGVGDEQKLVVCDDTHHFKPVETFPFQPGTADQGPRLHDNPSTFRAPVANPKNGVDSFCFGMRVPVARFTSFSRNPQDFQRVSNSPQTVKFDNLPPEIAQSSPVKCREGTAETGKAPRYSDQDWITNPPTLSEWQEIQDQAMRLAAVREACRCLSAQMEGTIAQAGAGSQIRLENHSFLGPSSLASQPGEYYVTQARLIASHFPEGGSWRDQNWDYRKQVQLTVLPAGQPFAPQPFTSIPRIHGAHTARVVGTDGVASNRPDLHRHGSVLLDFPWLNTPGPRRARVAQFWAGAGYGAMFWPRTGHEVVVVFEDGDPDRPLVVGSLYNGVNPPPEGQEGIPDGWVSGIISSPLIQGDVTAGMANYIKIYDDKNCQLATHSVTTAVNYSSANQYTLNGGGGLTISGRLI
jgi:uncharacterized protein involved in type VI secretion and phage assembly